MPRYTHRVQLGSIGRQVLDLDPAIQRIQVFVHEPAPVRGEAIPDDQQIARNAADQVLEEDHQVLGADRLFEQLEVEVPFGNASDQGQSLPVEVMEQDRSLPARRPSAAPVRPLTQSAFVDEDDRTPLFAGFFLMAGQVFCFHSAIADSFRSNAFPTGRCGLQFNCRRTFQTCPA